ncbi:hypothetical protein H312_02277 [Anncaliia algerae PRA339]|uniref:Uncharacterized protein n=1 Tax=Anncaliia algerae PRA339 TaxID=1288291 RepID=A0A059EZX7_9MICR|nr:hypothetical protein H312_02277 [Anncaliia algerae PRA339]
MAGSSSKKTIQSNKKTMISLLIGETIFLLIYLLLSVIKNTNVFTYIKIIPELLVILFLYNMSRPKYRDNRCIDSGVNLNSRGVIAIMFDFVYISWVVKILTLYTSLGYLLYFIMIFGIFYEFKGIFSHKK